MFCFLGCFAVGSFCSWDVMSWGVLYLRCFVARTLCLGMFCRCTEYKEVLEEKAIVVFINVLPIENLVGMVTDMPLDIGMTFPLIPEPVFGCDSTLAGGGGGGNFFWS